jgi:hypothetical protein
MARITSSAPSSSGLPTAYKPIDSQAVLDFSRLKWEALTEGFGQAVQTQRADW